MLPKRIFCISNVFNIRYSTFKYIHIRNGIVLARKFKKYNSVRYLISVKVTYDNKRAVIICQKQQIEKSVKDNICRGPFHFQSSSVLETLPLMLSSSRHYFPAPSSHPVTHGKISFNLHLGGLTSQLNDLETVVQYRTGCSDFEFSRQNYDFRLNGSLRQHKNFEFSSPNYNEIFEFSR